MARISGSYQSFLYTSNFSLNTTDEEESSAESWVVLGGADVGGRGSVFYRRT